MKATNQTKKKGANVEKPYLTEAPYLVIAMKLNHEINSKGEKEDVYYPQQSVGIACGMFITAVHNANLATLPSTPMGAEQVLLALFLFFFCI